MSTYSIFKTEVEKKIIDPILSSVLNNFSSAERQVYCNSTPEKLRKVSEGNLQIEFGVNKNSMKRLLPKEKVDFYILLILIEIQEKKRGYVITEWVDSWKLLLEKHLSGSDIVFTISKLDKIYSNQYLFRYFSDRKHQSNFFSILLGNRGHRGSFLSELCSEKFSLRFFEKIPPKPRKKIFRKGYRDHGSLGTEVSRTRKEERKDVFLQLDYEKEEKARQDTLSFIQGWLD